MKPKQENPKDKLAWQRRMEKSGSFVAVLIFNIAIFLMVSTAVIYHFIAPTLVEPMVMVKVRQQPPTPKPPANGGEAVKSLADPTAHIVPPPVSSPSIVISSNPLATFSMKSSLDPALTTALPTFSVQAAGGGMASGSSGGGMSHSNPFGDSLEDGATPELVGYMYDLKQTSGSSPKPTEMTPSKYHEILMKFVAANWDSQLIEKFYRTQKPLNTSSVFIPTIHAVDGPKAFGVENEVQPKMYVIWYRLTASPTEDGTYHFVGMADDILLVRVNGEMVLDGSLIPVKKDLWTNEKRYPVLDYKPTNDTEKGGLFVGTPVHLHAGDTVNIDVMIGEEPGGWSNYFLYLQREENTYQTQTNGSPLLPIFQVDTNPIHPKGAPGTYPPYSTTAEAWHTSSAN